MTDQDPIKRVSPLAKVMAVRGIALATLLGVFSLGLYVTSRGAQLRAFKSARAAGLLEDPPNCPTIEQHKEARLASDELDEVSGMIASRKQPGLFWLHNDSGDEARIFAVGRDGQLRAEIELDGVEARDFEDIALLSSANGPDVLYIADTGNNLKRRKTVQILKLPEPKVPQGNAVLKLERTPESVDIRYEDGTHDVEAMIVDARGDVYLITKAHLLAREDVNGVYRVTAEQMKGKQAVAHRVASLPTGPTTAADVSPDGRTVAVRNYWVALWWRVEPGQSLMDVFATPACHLWLRESNRQGEALTFLPDGGFITVSEGRHPELISYSYGPPKN